jgi:hypothetical protein
MANRPSDIQKAFEKAVLRTVNKLIVKGRKAATQQVRQVYAVKAGDLKDHTKIYRANRSRPEAKLVIRGRKMPIILFGAKQKAKGTTVRIKKAGGRKLIQSAFIATMKSGKIQVWLRKGKSRLPIRQLFTVSPPKMFEKEGEKSFQEIIRRDVGPTLKHELQFYLGRIQ